MGRKKGKTQGKERMDMLELGVGTGADSDHPGGLGYTMLTHTQEGDYFYSPGQ